MTRSKAYLLTLLGASLWGTIGLFVEYLYQAGFTPWETVAIRAVFSAVFIVFILAVKFPGYLKIKMKDLPFFMGTGIVSIVFFNYCYFLVIQEASLSLAVVLLYTGPLFVTVLSRLLFKEWLTPRKLLALGFTITGCAFAVGLLPGFQTTVTTLAIAAGIASGFFYALYSIFGKYVSRTYHSITITAYSFICASLLMIPAGGLAAKSSLLFQPQVLLFAFGLAIVPTVLAYILYTLGLTHIESSRASILSTIEPVVAIIIGVAVFGDRLDGWQTLGVLLVLSSVLLVAETKKTNTVLPADSL